MQLKKSFASNVKNEVYSNKQYRIRHKLAQGYGLIMFSKHFSRNEVSLVTENRGVAHLYREYIYELTHIQGSITTHETLHNDGNRVYTVSVDYKEDCEQILNFFSNQEEAYAINFSQLTKEGDLEAFLSGVYLACGNITDPLKGYHLEFVLSNANLEKSFCELMDILNVHYGVTLRRGQVVVYIKENEQIQDVLTMVGATQAIFQLIDVMIYKELRNKANRQTNCETANIDKTVRAASEQLSAIRLLISNGILEDMPDDLRELAQLRLDNPEMSLRELGENHTLKLSRSAVNNRMQKIILLSQQT